MSSITSTNFILPQAVISNGESTGNSWSNPENLLLVDGLLSESNPNAGAASDVIIGNYNTNLPQNAVVTGIEMELIAKEGSPTVPSLALTIYAVDNTSGQDVFFPYTAPVSLTETLDTYVLGSPTYLFDTSLTPDQVNNLKFQLVANGDIYVDSFLLKVYYYIPATPEPPEPSGSNCATCNSPIQVQRMFLQLPFLAGDTKFYLQPGSMTYPDGTPIEPTDVGACGGEIDFVFDQGKAKGNSNNNFEENVVLNLSSGFWTVLPSGVVEVDIGSINNRGIQFHTPLGHDAGLLSDHDANSEVIITNNARFESRFVRRCEVGTTFSAPIDIQKDGSDVVNPATKLNFIGAGVSVTDAGSGEADITIPGFSPIPPNVTNELSFYENTQVSNYSTPSFSVTGTDRLLMLALTIESGIGITSAEWNSVALTFVTSSTIDGFTCWIAYLVAPDLGSHTLDMVFAAPTMVAGNLVAYTQVDQSSPLAANVAGGGNSNTASLSPTTATQNSIVFHSLSTKHFPILYTAGGGESLISVSLGGTLQSGVENQSVGTPAMVTTQVSLSAVVDWSDIALGINGIQPTPAVQSVTGLDTDNTDPANPVVKISVDGVTITGDGTPGNPLQSSEAGSAVQSVTGLNTDNANPLNPVVKISVDGATITGDGTPGNPLVAPGGSGSIYSVNADETITTWQTVQIPAPFSYSVGVGGAVSAWQGTGFASGNTQYANGADESASVVNVHNRLYDMNITANNIGAPQTFGVDFVSRIKYIATMKVGSNTASTPATFARSFVGFSDLVGDQGDITDPSGRRIGFATYDGNIYAVCSDGTNITATSFVTSAGTYALPTIHQFAMVITGTTSVDFYCDGILVATIATHLPTTGNCNLNIYGADGAAGGNGGCSFISHFTYSQKLL